jgi:murein DD-endopeptidase MepM/ murein hydrolase activator NlpD
MANTPTNPLASPIPFAGSDEASQQYLRAQDELMRALENRSQPNLFQVAGALAKPTMTGSALEALGAGASEYGRQVAEQEKLEPSLIQMRAGLAAQKYELQNRTKALSMMGQLLGSDNSQETMEKLSTGDFTPSQLMNLVQAQPKIAMYDKNAGEIVNNLVKNLGTVQDLNIKAKAENRQGEEFTYKQMKEADEFYQKTGKYPSYYTPPTAPQPKTQETTKTPPAELSNLFGNNLKVTSGFGMRTLNGQEQMHGGIDLAPKDGKAGQPISSPVDGQVVMAGPMQGYGKAVVVKRDDGHMVLFGHVDPTVEIGTKIKQGDVVGKIGNMLGTTTGNHVEVKVLDPKGKPINPLDYKPLTSLVQKPVETQRPSNEVLVASTNKYAGLPPEEQRKQVAKDFDTERDLNKLKDEKQFESSLKASETKKSILNSLGEPMVVEETDNDARRLFKLVKDNRDVMDLLNQSGGIGQLAQAGISTPWGGFSADVNTFLQRSQLSPEKQAIARQIGQLTAKLNQSIMKQGKEIYGPTIAASEAVLMSRPGFEATDASGFIMSMTQRMILQNEYIGKIKEAFDDWQQDHPRETADKFFRRSNSSYASIIKEYTQLLKKLPEPNKFYSVTIEPAEKGKK